MSDAHARIDRAFAQLEVALQEVIDAHQAVPDEEYNSQLPSVLVCICKPTQQASDFTLLGHVTHVAEALGGILTDPGHAPLHEALMQAMERRLFLQGLGN